MKKLILIAALAGFATGSILSSPVAYSDTQEKLKRGEDPWCQKECLKEHSERMAALEERLSKTGNKFAYQNLVEEEEGRYARCLTNCREVIPVK
jgi:hypothetical protein